MEMDVETCYRALSARDPRFDGLFFVGVKSTGIYCRPVCTAKTPGRARCQFFRLAALAERAGFRPCLRCRPELAPGSAPLDAVRSTAQQAAAAIEAGALNDGRGLEDLASQLGLSSRQLRRNVLNEFGVTPIELAQTHRLLLAKRLIAETQLPLTQVAFAAGFESVRRFNALFLSHYRLTPRALRRSAQPAADDCLRLRLAFRPPYAWQAMLKFLAARAIPGVECVTQQHYARTVAIAEHRGWLRVSRVADCNQLMVELSTSLTRALPAILARLKQLFDLDARPDVIDRQLSAAPRLASHVARQPGLRLPGAFDPFELSWRAVLGQQVSVRGASTLAGRMAERLGEPLGTPVPGLKYLSPAASAVATCPLGVLQAIGLPATRAACLQSLAAHFAAEQFELNSLRTPPLIRQTLQQLPGIGPWTAEYIVMRAWHWPDAFPTGDLGLHKATGIRSRKQLQAIAENWRPWRAYAAMHLWQSLSK